MQKKLSMDKNLDYILRHGTTAVRRFVAAMLSIEVAWVGLEKAAQAARRSAVLKETPGKKLQQLADEVGVIARNVLPAKRREHFRSAKGGRHA